jgi:hypothetical protein
MMQVAGGIVYWSLGGSVDVGALKQEFENVGLDPSLLPVVPTESVALKRAVQARSEHRLLARPVNRGKTWLLVKESPNGSDADYAIETKASLESGQLVVSSNNGVGDEIRSAFDHALSHYDPSDIASWLVRIAYNCKAVALRPRGGVYFVPRENIDTFNKFISVLSASVAPECSVYRIPALQSDEAVQAILAAIEEEATAAIAEIEADVANCVQNRVKESRRLLCAQLVEKVKYYEDLLSANLDSLRTRIEDLNISLAESVLSTEEEEATV